VQRVASTIAKLPELVRTIPQLISSPGERATRTRTLRGAKRASLELCHSTSDDETTYRIGCWTGAGTRSMIRPSAMAPVEDGMRKPQTAYLEKMDEDEQLEWASNALCEITDRHAMALDLQGWKIVNKDDPNCRWPFDSKSAGCVSPDWCEDLSKPKLTVVLN
jgi:hypothetical protein